MTFARGFLAPFLAMSGMGMLGILCLIPSLRDLAEKLRGLPDAADLPGPALTVLLLVQPTALLLAGTALGVALAEKAGLASLMLRRLRGEIHRTPTAGWGSTLVLAVLLASAVAAADLVFRKFAPEAFAHLPRLDDVTLSGRLLGLLYGGVTEELMMRFGLMSLFLWLGLRLTGGRGRSLLVWTSIVLSSLAFAAAHLGVLAGAGAQDHGVLTVRTIGLNGVLGLLFGWLYAHRSLEHAMLAHAASHATFWFATPFLVALGL